MVLRPMAKINNFAAQRNEAGNKKRFGGGDDVRWWCKPKVSAVSEKDEFVMGEKNEGKW